MNKRHHQSHHIFAFLGALLLIFIIFFGIQAFEKTYNFEDISVDDAQGYYDGANTTNPFFPHPDDALAQVADYHWVTFGSPTFSFVYPDQYALRVMNSNTVSVIPPLNPMQEDDCSLSTDEQLRAQCEQPDMSPHITITVGVDQNEWLPGMSLETAHDMVVGDIALTKNSVSGEYGGVTAYRRQYDNTIVQVSYRYVDTPGGVQFETLHSIRGNQYQLTAEEQDLLALTIIESIKLK